MSTTDTTTDDEKAQADLLLQQKLGEPPKDETPEPPAPTSEDDVEKPIVQKDWHFEAEYEVQIRGENTTQQFSRTYTQKPLSFHAMGEFTGLLGRKIEEAMRGPDGLSVDRIGGVGGLPLEFNDGSLSLARSDFEGADSVIQGIAKLASYVPEFLAEAQCIWLRVPRTERPLLLDIWSRPVDEGGMSMGQGEEMLRIFIEQNYDELESFLTRYGRLKETVNKMRQKRNPKED